ncbi:MAG: response regulator [Nitrospinae bacterium]|nr:response regulator [Nitrospinota bacterium]
MNEKILCVDDDPNILSGFKRSLSRRFALDTALGGEEGLEAAAKNGPYAVIVSDMRMPGMDGVRFLAKAREISPDSVRMMLTGYADINSAMDAVNEGNIFRFLTKPCPPEVFAKALDDGIAQYRLVIAERELLEKTLSGSVKALVDILSMVNPAAFGRAARIRKYAKHIIARLNLSQTWRIELAAILSQIGCVTIPPDTIEKYYAGQPLNGDELQMLAAHPMVAFDLLVKIPRLEQVAMMIGAQQKPFGEYNETREPRDRPEEELGAQILKVAVEMDRLVSHGSGFGKAVDEMMKGGQEYDPSLVTALRGVEPAKAAKIAGLVKIRDLAVGMIIGEDLYSKSNMLLLPKGQEITFTMRERIKNLWRNGLVDDQIRVLFDIHERPELNGSGLR